MEMRVEPGFRAAVSDTGLARGPLPGSFLACPSPKTAWGRDLGSLRSRLLSRPIQASYRRANISPGCPHGQLLHASVLARSRVEAGRPAVPAPVSTHPAARDRHPPRWISSRQSRSDFGPLLPRIHSPSSPPPIHPKHPPPRTRRSRRASPGGSSAEPLPSHPERDLPPRVSRRRSRRRAAILPAAARARSPRWRGRRWRRPRARRRSGRRCAWPSARCAGGTGSRAPRAASPGS